MGIFYHAKKKLWKFSISKVLLYKFIKKILSCDGPPPPIFICENNRKSNKIMHCVEEKKNLIGSFKDKAIFHVILEIDR